MHVRVPSDMFSRIEFTQQPIFPCRNGHPTGYVVVLGFGAAFSVFTTILVYIEKYFTGSQITSEQFK